LGLLRRRQAVEEERGGAGIRPGMGMVQHGVCVAAVWG
jgi:hypothetical protein